MKIRLTRKYSQQLNGIDLTHAHEGDTLDLPSREADMLMAEGWAVAEDGPDRAHERARKRRPATRTTSKRRAKKR